MYTAYGPHDFRSITHDSANGFSDVTFASFCRNWYWLHSISPSPAFVYYIPPGEKAAEIDVHVTKNPQLNLTYH